MAETREYVIRRAAGPVRLACDHEAWTAADRLAIDRFPWYVSGNRQATDVAVLYDDRAVYALFVCEDKHINSVETRPNGNVYLDSCVEFFAQPDPDAHPEYFNFEANCCGTVHLGWCPDRHGRKLAGPEVHDLIRVKTSIAPPTRVESPNDDGWWLAVELPFEALSRFGGFKVAPASGTRWRANFYRIGGRTDVQYGCWNRNDCEKPDYHQSKYFGNVIFE